MLQVNDSIVYIDTEYGVAITWGGSHWPSKLSHCLDHSFFLYEFSTDGSGTETFYETGMLTGDVSNIDEAVKFANEYVRTEILPAMGVI